MKKNLLKICISSCAFFFALAIGCFLYFNNANRTYAYDIVTDEGQQVEKVYDFGSTFTLPSASFKVNGQEIPATDRYIIYPNGKIYTSDTVKLNVQGEYTIVYSAVIDGKKVKDESTKFCVYSNAWTNNYESTIVTYEESLKHKEGTDGLHVALSEGDMWTFNHVVDLSDNTSEDPVLEFSPWNCSTLVTKTDEKGEVYNRKNDPETTNIYIRLTDAYDSENYLNVRMFYYRLSAERYQTYITVSAPGIDSIGLRQSDSGKIVINNVGHEIIRNSSNRGSYSAEGFRATRGARLYYDNETKVISFFDGQALLYITDLDNKDIYPVNMFKGFTTGEVYLSIYSELNNDAQTNYDIYSVDGIKGASLAETVIDKKAPVIHVDVEESLVRDGFAIAKNETFKIFDAEAFDVNPNGEVSTIVYYNYGYENNMCMTYNGTFTPKETGVYAIVYKAIDAFGNEQEKIIELVCVDREKTILFTLGDFESSYENAKDNKLPDFSFDTLNNPKKIKLTITAEKDGKVYEIDPTSNILNVEEAGIYTITYAYGDGIVSYTESHEINVVSSDNIALNAEDACYPEYFIKGMKYTLDPVYGFTYNTGSSIAHEPEFYVSNDGGNFVKADMFDLLIEADSNVRFKYVFSANGKNVEYVTEPFTVINNAFDPSKAAFKERYLQGNYFYGNVSTEQLQTALLLKPEALGTVNVDFINVLSLKSFQFEFTVPEGYDNFASIRLQLIDFYDRDNIITITYRGNKTTSYVKFNDFIDDPIQRPFVSSTAFRVEYDKGTSFIESSGLTVDTRQSFTSDKILLHLSFVGVSGQAGISISKINGQQFTKFASDLPGTLAIDTTYKGAYGLNETVYCFNGIPNDVMNPFYGKNFSIEVKYVSPEGFAETVISDDGTPLSFASSWLFKEDGYAFTLDKVGNYRIAYSYTDQGGKSVSATNLIQVSDAEPPKFQIMREGQVLSKDSVIVVDLFTNFEFPGVQATDNITSTNQMTIGIVLMRPDTAQVNITDGRYTFKDKGMYRVSYMVFDGSGNYSYDYFFIRVR